MLQRVQHAAEGIKGNVGVQVGAGCATNYLDCRAGTGSILDPRYISHTPDKARARFSDKPDKARYLNIEQNQFEPKP